MKTTPNRDSGGFTLIELILILIILSLTIAMVLPRVGAGWKRMGEREFLQEFIQTLKRARILAMNSGTPVIFRISGAERTYGILTPPESPIPDNVDVFADHLEMDPETGDHIIAFFPDGSMFGSDLEITFDRERSFHISVHPLFGSIRYYRVEPR